MMERNGCSEALHKVRGSVEVARDLVDRASILYGQCSDAAEQRVVEGLTLAANALIAASDVLDEELVAGKLGPAA